MLRREIKMELLYGKRLPRHAPWIDLEAATTPAHVNSTQ